MMPAGKIIGFLFVAPFSNRFGRKKSLALAFVISVIGAALQAASVNLGLLIFSRFALGFGCGVMSQPSPILFVDAIAAAWITFGTLRTTGPWSWRIPTLLQGATPFLQLIFSYFLPESPRQIRDAVRTENNSEKRPTLEKMLASPANRRRLLISAMVGIVAQWSGNTVVSYYLVLVLNGVGITNATHQSLINGGLQIFNLLATVGCGSMLVATLGRRRLFQWCAVGMTMSYVIWTILNSRFDATGSAGFGYAVIPMLFVFYFHYDIVLTPLLYSYPTELFPYEWRSRRVAFTLIVTNVTLIISQVCNPIAMAKLGQRYFILFWILDCLFILQVWFLFPETNWRFGLDVAESRYRRIPQELAHSSDIP
ncbi:major facilitator superfamily domain-containing protein [Dactylonectria estremocensis]|uniref:Major facilitator superfamily domain-containing protein n=1 Tax=Dactylonectria estremocensis TaxID=1079267 RepID=A0A9P9EXY0_9HYPO|nr:major facilitator superfamily domain-containing protein [Dactylonectria estremocensis]